MLERLFKILSADWLIHRDTAISYIPAMIAFLNGQKIEFDAVDEAKPTIAVLSRESNQLSLVGEYQLEDPDIPENSVAVLPIQDVILSWKTQRMISWIRQADANPSISSVLFLVSSPGGMVSQLDVCANAIKACTKPTTVVIIDMAASAAMWLASAANYRIATSRMAQVGSIGTKTTISDFSGMFDKLGIKFTDIYATLSTRKEEAAREHAAGNDAPIVAMLDFINGIFHQTIRENLSIKEDSEVFEGAIYFAEKAKELGLINEINSLEYAVQYAYEQGLATKIKQFKF